MTATLTQNKAKQHFDKEAVKLQASGKWQGIIQAICNIDASRLDGRAGPCPRASCGGHNRFNVYADFDETGGCACRQCDLTSADGLGFIQKYLGVDLDEACRLVGEYLDFQPREKKRSKQADAAKEDPAKHLDWQPWSDDAAKFWATKNKPIDPSVLLKLHPIARMAMYRRSHPVIALSITGSDDSEVGFCLFHRTGKELPAWTNGVESPVKIKNTSGSLPGWIGPKIDESIQVVWKVEGPKDLLTMLSLGLPEGHSACTNAFGAGENPAKTEWMLKQFANKVVYVLHDCDQPGQDGAMFNKKGKPGWAPAIATVAKEVRNIVLPYPIEGTHGKDLRDFANERLDAGESKAAIYQEILKLAEQSSIVKAAELQKPKEAELQAITNRRLKWNEEKERSDSEPIQPVEILEHIQKNYGRPLKRINDEMFVSAGGQVQYIRRQEQLFGFLRGIAAVDWGNGSDHCSKSEFFEYARNNCDSYEGIELAPHWPKIETHYYACDWPTSKTSGEYLERFISFFNCEDELDRQLMMAAVVTPFWGGPPKERAAFLITASTAQGSGKSTFVFEISNLTGCSPFVICHKVEAKDLNKELLSGATDGKRILLLDNVKTSRFSSEAIETLITSPTIAGHRMFIGHSNRANLITVYATINGPALSTDLATRFIPIRLLRGEYSDRWTKDLRDLVDNHREKILADIGRFFDRESKAIGKQNRWALWQREILGRLPDPDAVSSLIELRSVQNDADHEFIRELHLELYRRLKRFRIMLAGKKGTTFLDPDGKPIDFQLGNRVHIPSDIMKEVASYVAGEQLSARRVGDVIDRAGAKFNLSRNTSRAVSRGYVFEGNANEPIRYFLADESAKNKFLIADDFSDGD